MGADYYAKAVVGVVLPNEVDLPRAKTSVRKKAYQHGFEDDGRQEFDPKTGKNFGSTKKKR